MISEDQETLVTTEDIKIVQTENFEYKVIFPNEDIIDSRSVSLAEDEVKISTPSVSEIIASM